MIESSPAALRNGASRVGIGLSSPATKRIEEWRVPDARVTASFSSNRASEYRSPIQKPMVLPSIAPNAAERRMRAMPSSCVVPAKIAALTHPRAERSESRETFDSKSNSLCRCCEATILAARTAFPFPLRLLYPDETGLNDLAVAIS
jgi:hypothetical protein